MLKIALKRDEPVSIEVGDQEVKIKVIGYNGSKYIVGFEANKEVKILREKRKGKEVPEDKEHAN